MTKQIPLTWFKWFHTWFFQLFGEVIASINV